ncbi:ASCH domain-containing protein [Virgibacillus sp. NKC19-16]|uniref:ASCH domain-containing protein n=1 Tax=Virgibacillus salidurans TaxID=2831673 RepID=UPI001F29F4BC|nr:ASCH domain-containing protein [Virgibacillus sp. NKC19-16]UJL45650.1 ASCH domain-containing protein [Virgibacillus sp. NKC19-16]
MNNKNHSLPPKRCSIDRLVTIPADIDKVINGEKTATRRNDRYADVDEVMVLNNRRFIVTDVYEQKLGDVTDEDALKEGFQNVEEYKQSILSIHPGMKWEPEMNVWVHEFESAE